MPDYRKELLAQLILRAGREGGILSKALGQPGTIPEDERYLRQYLSPERNLLPRAGQEGEMAVRKMGLDPNEPSYFTTTDLSRGGLTPKSSDLASRLLGLGKYNLNIISRENQPIVAQVEDIWDFDPIGTNRFVRALMKRIGKPYKIREEVPIKHEESITVRPERK